jgi:hypothetical protein
MAMEHLQSETWWHSSTRKDYVYIFEWLRLEAKVQKILKIIVVDDLCNFHSDEVIEHAVRPFGVESFNWVKLDICSDAILVAAKDVREVTLHWSGNNAILRSWTASDGLVKLKEASSVFPGHQIGGDAVDRGLTYE